MYTEVIPKLISEKKGPCLSIIVPQYKLTRERMQNPELYRKAIRKAKALLKRKMIPLAMQEKLDKELTKYKPVYAQGLGIYLSPRILEVVYFPFPVKEKIVLDNSFETRDLYYLQQFLMPYHVFVCGKDRLALYAGTGDDLTEINDGVFPAHYEDDYEYARPAIGTSFGGSLKGFEKDKGDLVKKRTHSFISKTVKHLLKYTNNSTKPLIIAGTKTQLSALKNMPELKGKIAAEIVGSYTEQTLPKLREKVLEALTKYMEQRTENLVHDFKENDRPDRIAKGLQETWQAVQEGRGRLLLVEKDYARPSYLRKSDPSLYLFPPKGKYTIVPDAVDNIIERMHDQGGKVVFAKSNKLRAFDSIALLLRY